MNWGTRAACVAAILGAAWHAPAAESGGSAYKDGAESLMAGALPPPGQYLVDYLFYYQADKMADAKGNDQPIGFKLRAVANIARFVNVTTIEVLGAQWAQHVFVPVVWADVKIAAANVKDSAVTLGDVIVDPFILGWHRPPFHWVVGVDTYVPVGRYDTTEPAAAGRNYWTFQPVAAATYLDDDGLEVSAKLMYDINTENRDTGYTSGQAFHADFVTALHSGDWAGGVCGFWHVQTADDKNAAGAIAGSRARQVGLGPVLSYQCGPMNFSVAYQHELATENRPEGGRAWLKFVMPL